MSASGPIGARGFRHADSAGEEPVRFGDRQYLKHPSGAPDYRRTHPAGQGDAA